MPNKKLLLLAAGGHGQVVLDTLLSQGLEVAGILDPALPAGSLVFGAIPVLGSDDWLDGRDGGGFMLANGAGSVPGSPLRRRWFDAWKLRGFGFVSVRHPSAVIGRDAALLEGSQVMAGAVVQPNAVIGSNAVINTRASVDHDCRIGGHAFIGPGAVLCGDVQVGADAFVGAGAVLLPGVRVGDGAIVGAGAIVAKDVPDGALVVGNPAAIRPNRHR